MKIICLLLSTFCFYSAIYYRSATRYLRLLLNSNDIDLIMKRLTDMQPFIGNNPTDSYLEKTSVKIFRILAIGVAIMSCGGASDFYPGWGPFFVAIIGGGIAITKKMNIQYINLFIIQARSFLIVSFIIICGFLFNAALHL